MQFVTNLLLLLHIFAVVMILGLWLAHFKPPTVTTGQLYGAILALATGLVLVIIREAGHGRPLNHVKIAVKLLIALGVLIAAFIGWRKEKKGQPVPTGLAHSVGAGALANFIIAIMWS